MNTANNMVNVLTLEKNKKVILLTTETLENITFGLIAFNNPLQIRVVELINVNNEKFITKYKGGDYVFF